MIIPNDKAREENPMVRSWVPSDERLIDLEANARESDAAHLGQSNPTSLLSARKEV